jgi:carbamoyltransferase
MKEKLNAKIKHREEFRPFAPVVLAEEVDAWFDAPPPLDNPFMLQVWPFKRDVRHLVPAVVHVDGTGRVQVVTRESNQRLHAVLREFFRRTGVPLLLNTSLNVSGQPIVETPQDALRCLLETELDCCVIQDLLVTKSHPRR